MGARYYACWLARWTAADPAGTVDGTNLYAYVRGSPIVFRDPTGTEIYLDGIGEKARQKALTELQKLTDDKIAIEKREIKKWRPGGCCASEGEKEYRYEVVVDKEHKPSKEEPTKWGTLLVRELITGAHDVSITQGDDGAREANKEAANRDEKGRPGSGSDTTVTFDFTLTDKTEAYFWVKDEKTGKGKGKGKGQQGNRHITLGHELIHAWRFSRGLGQRVHGGNKRNPNNPYNDTPTEAPEPLDELETIGVDPWSYGGITENHLRREHGMSERLSWRITSDPEKATTKENMEKRKKTPTPKRRQQQPRRKALPWQHHIRSIW